jgi:hypothetical protein
MTTTRLNEPAQMVQPNGTVAWTITTNGAPIPITGSIVTTSGTETGVAVIRWTAGAITVTRLNEPAQMVQGTVTTTRLNEPAQTTLLKQGGLYIIQTGFTALANTTKFIDGFNATGSNVKLKIVQIAVQKDMSAQTGVALKWDLIRTTSVGTGAATTANPLDTATSALPAQVTFRVKPPGGAAAGTTICTRYYHSEETNVAAQVQEAFPFWPMARPPNIYDQPLTIAENTGFMVQMNTNSTAGVYNVIVVFFVE